MSEALKPMLRAALKDCSNWRAYWWKQRSMEKLAALGFVERLPAEDRAGQLAYRITDAGRAALQVKP